MAKPTLKIEKTKDRVTLLATGDLTVQHAKELHGFLLNNCDHKKEVHLVLKDVTALDVACIQLVYAWRKYIRKQDGNAIIRMPADSSLLDLLEKTGITKIF
jgi:anti-anti-sigma regulatory factor